ncbi:MAG: C1 family peptidase [Clostridia bacterium]|nr:C1 family peptidase [Clostridia bacterium]
MKRKVRFLAVMILFLVITQSTMPAFAFSFGKPKINLELGEYSQAYKEWLELPEVEKEKVIQPSIVDIEPIKVNTANPLSEVGSALSSSEKRFSLKDIIPGNVIVRNQERSELCWAFSTLASLESNLGLKDYTNNNPETKYDFSEKHMGYASSNSFLNNASNKYGLVQGVNSQSSLLTSHTYLVNGAGAVNEESMPYDMNFPNIDYDSFKDIKPVTQVSDIETFGGTADKRAIIQKIKDNIVKYGGVTAAIHGAQPYSGSFNPETGAIYCNNSTKFPANHAVSIIGWDDDYSVNNFVETMKPSSNGAFIIKNSWGDRYVIKFNSEEFKMLKQIAYEPYAEQYKEMGINSAEEIPDSSMVNALKNMGFEANDTEAWMKMGDDGIMYVSYEDVNILSLLVSIQKADYKTSNEIEYQYDYTEYNAYMATTSDSYYLAIKLDKSTGADKGEEIKRVGMWTISPVQAKVFVNPNGTSTKNLVEATLAEGEYETLTPGYHTLEFANPIPVEGDTFTVFVQCTPTEKEDGKSYFPLVCNTGDPRYANVDVKVDRTFYYESLNSYVDLGKASELNNQFSNYTATLKVFTGETEGNGNGNNNNNNNPPSQLDFKHSNFSLATSKIAEMYDYTFSDPNQQEYLIMNFEVNNIFIDMDRKYTYQYHLSNVQGEWNISNWYDMKEVKTSSNQLKFIADSRDIAEFASLLQGQRIYLYIREVEELNGETDAMDSTAIVVFGNDKAVTYKDGNVVSVVNDGGSTSQPGSTSNYNSSGNSTSNSNNGGSNTNKDDTTAKSVLPNTGFKDVLLITMFVFTSAGIVLYVLYRKIEY